VLFAALSAGGCTEQQVGWDPFAKRGKVFVPAGSISIHELASRLGLTVKSSTTTRAVLVQPGNQVMIYADPGGQVYVNGRAVVQGGIVEAAGVLHVPGRTPQEVRLALRTPRRRPNAARVPPPRRRLTKIAAKIVVDPGHGGKDPGAIAPGGMHEKAIVLDVARQVADRLRSAGATVKMTRSTDTFVELEDRAAMANRFGADLFVSIHADSARRVSAQGFGTYLAPMASSSAVAAADAIGRRLSGAGVPKHGTFRKQFRVLVLTRCPAVLIELGFLSNPAEAARLGAWSYRRKLAEAIAEGIRDFASRS